MQAGLLRPARLMNLCCHFGHALLHDDDTPTIRSYSDSDNERWFVLAPSHGLLCITQVCDLVLLHYTSTTARLVATRTAPSLIYRLRLSSSLIMSREGDTPLSLAGTVKHLASEAF